MEFGLVDIRAYKILQQLKRINNLDKKRINNLDKRKYKSTLEPFSLAQQY